MKWIHLEDKEHNGLIVHEIQCPFCGYKVTYHNDNVPDNCYVCSFRININEDRK